MTFGDQLRKLVKSRGLNFTSLAKKMGVTNAYISQLVTGIRKPGRKTLLNLSKTLELPIDALLTLGDVGIDYTVPKKIPVLNETSLIAWITSGKVEYPVLYADTFEYALSGGPYTFYLQPSDTKGAILGYDLILVEPMAAIKHRDTVLTCFHDCFALSKIVMADGLAILFNERQEHVVSLKENNIDGLSLFRAIQGIKNI